MQSLVRIHNKLKMKYENKQCSKPQVGIFATDSDSVPDLQQIYNQFLVDHRFKIGCNSVNDNFGQQPIYNRIYIESQVDPQVEIRLQIGCHFFIWNNQIKTVFLIQILGTYQGFRRRSITDSSGYDVIILTFMCFISHLHDHKSCLSRKSVMNSYKWTRWVFTWQHNLWCHKNQLQIVLPYLLLPLFRHKVTIYVTVLRWT